ncbi:MAG: D-2-hydroxyacid dehydrogenase [Planctomycetia bacterium]|nr:D-2-hydroxyacid dehydrogenase [Planctomycetia bacterium]
MKIVILDGYTTNPGDLSWNGFEELGDLTIYDRTLSEEKVARAFEAEIVLSNKVVLDAATIAQLPHLKYIGLFSTGYNVVDLQAARARGIPVTNIPSYSTESVVQSTFAHLLNIASNLSQNTTTVRNGDWVKSIDFCYWNNSLMELFGKTLGIVGFGTIGQRVAQVAQAFGMNVLAYGRHLNPGEIRDGVLFVPFESLLQKSDIISLHCPLNDDNRHFINQKSLAMVKRGAILINTARGPLLDEQAVADALNEGRLGGFGADVLSTEPPQNNNPLLNAKNSYITAHNAWATFEARSRLISIAVANVQAFLNGKPQNVVN